MIVICSLVMEIHSWLNCWTVWSTFLLHETNPPNVKKRSSECKRWSFHHLLIYATETFFRAWHKNIRPTARAHIRTRRKRVKEITFDHLKSQIIQSKLWLIKCVLFCVPSCKVLLVIKKVKEKRISNLDKTERFHALFWC